MHEGGQPDKPAILVFSAHASAIETEVLAGIEEEGVPFVVERPDAADGAVVLAGLAAARSSLSVGVGIDDSGRVCVQHQKLADPQAGLHTPSTASPVAARSLGHNAARMVVGIPLRMRGLGYE
ncbi:glycerol dehydratase reactivase beta/small subunit family protein [Mycobacterium sp. ITM-2016-00317]|uniref:glycerol dehydratase reactivase beta/small subunit family protein n=1 Tax=Mycobacterium sp. ITM-2016-00317 TaxID=2099694 RepID=UPI000D41A34B|nr:glycerol dehydratase reactivase beta/small subunit family protein [Mycobacterium sp. ITM-2016-00317]WNG88776.1 glycerol dehydratase reactivase beta/small subunit family protein [Mycobacterium sp. ITM-2016-00317]